MRNSSAKEVFRNAEDGAHKKNLQTCIIVVLRLRHLWVTRCWYLNTSVNVHVVYVRTRKLKIPADSGNWKLNLYTYGTHPGDALLRTRKMQGRATHGKTKYDHVSSNGWVQTLKYITYHRKDAYKDWNTLFSTRGKATWSDTNYFSTDRWTQVLQTSYFARWRVFRKDTYVKKIEDILNERCT